MTSGELEGRVEGSAPAGRGPTGQRWVTVASIVIVLACLLVLARILPVERAVGYLRGWIEVRGVAGALWFGVAYVVAGLAFVPGAALTMAAGAVFGLVGGTVIVSVSSTLTAALAFLVARYAARRRVAGWAKRNPKFGAIDRAIAEQGWKIVALLRLSPAMPYSLGNYLYGLTAIRFVPYVLASWCCMLPGTILYVFIGHAGAAGVAAASKGTGQTGRAVLLVVGLTATIAVTFLITRAARRALAQREGLDIHSPSGGLDSMNPDDRSVPPGSRFLLPVLAGVLLVVTVVACSARQSLIRVLGPPRVTMVEAYSDPVGGATFAQARFDALLKRHVDGRGLVDYAALKKDSAELDRYIESVGRAGFDELGRDEKLALLLNAYNAFTLRLILDHHPVRSIKDIPAEERWEAVRWMIAGRTYSLDQIENELIRPRFAEPRIHFALVCAALGCPPLRQEAYTGERLDRQLHEQAVFVHSRDTWFRFDPGEGRLRLTPLYHWYGDDFRQAAGSPEKFAARYSDALQAALDRGQETRVEYLDYDWSLNRQKEEDR